MDFLEAAQPVTIPDATHVAAADPPVGPSSCSSKSEDGSSQSKTFSRDQIAQHCSPDDCWIIIHNLVLDVTAFLEIHPGSDVVILDYAGLDATEAFEESGHGPGPRRMLADWCIGTLEESPAATDGGGQ